MSRRHWDFGWPRYVRAAERKANAKKRTAKMAKDGETLSPVQTAGRTITSTFWGNNWCANLESYSDYSNRLPRGRTYLRSGSVIDLKIETGKIRAQVEGSNLYRVEIAVPLLAKKKWEALKKLCMGKVSSLVELLGGTLSDKVMESVSDQKVGLYPSPREIKLRCSCPDWATMCKHVAATLYGVGVRLDTNPELLFALRGVDHKEMLESALSLPTGSSKARKGRTLATDDLASVFNIDLDDSESAPAPASQAPRSSRLTSKPKQETAPQPDRSNPLQSDPQVKTKAAVSSGPKANPKAKATTKPKGKAKAKPKTKPTAKPTAKPKIKATTKPKTKPKLKPKTKPKTKPMTKPKAKPKAKAKVRIQSERTVKASSPGKDPSRHGTKRTQTKAKVPARKTRT